MPRRNRLDIDGALSSLAAIEAVAAALVTTAPKAVAAMGGIEAVMAASEMTAIGPMPRFTLDQWSAMALERIGVIQGGIPKM